MSEILWQPNPQQVQQSQMFGFLQAVNKKFSLKLETYSKLHAWSVQNLTDFWEFYNQYSKIQYRQNVKEVLSSRTMHEVWNRFPI